MRLGCLRGGAERLDVEAPGFTLEANCAGVGAKSPET